MTFPLVNIRRQLTLFFGRKDFEVTCRKWAERENETEALFDIYDGRIWMSFEDGKGEPFFKKEYAETHIGLMLNMDWFQPYINSQYSVANLKCATEESRKAHVSQYHVRWSEVYQLPYFNSVRFCVVDPMHCLFLGVAKWIVMKLWIDEGILNNEKLKIMQERADLIKFPSDLGRRPVRIATGDGFSNFTADIFERMNGILGSYKNSKRNIEPELLKIMVESSFLNYYLTNCDSNILNTTLDIIKPRKSAGSLTALDDFTSDEYQNFLRLSLIENESAYGTERFPGLLIKPRQETFLPNRVLDLLVEFYNSLYEEHFVPIYSITGPNNDIVVISKIIQYGRIRIGADIFGSIQAARHEKSSYILARFEQEDGTIDTYLGQVQFYFEHTIYLKNSSSLTHSLALVKWYRPAQDHRTRYFCQVDDDIKSCNIELWTNGFYDMSRDSIIPVHHILGKFIKCDFNIGTRKIKEYMAVIPLNKKISF
ncbi:hypothetical protein RIR_jg16610.t5 [Rhizophagus irregularis DAOM 181602=DAOM 197198]|nr:hypothetical protein RIR_jg16610.t5 [Rhizophagus irregularis DAOM 181602=DAOM 197198]